jgi:hypothetical protein
MNPKTSSKLPAQTLQNCSRQVTEAGREKFGHVDLHIRPSPAKQIAFNDYSSVFFRLPKTTTTTSFHYPPRCEKARSRFFLFCPPNLRTSPRCNSLEAFRSDKKMPKYLTTTFSA